MKKEKELKINVNLMKKKPYIYITIFIISLIIIIVTVLVSLNNQTLSIEKFTTQESTIIISDNQTSIIENQNELEINLKELENNVIFYEGEIISGTEITPYVRYNKKDYDNAIKENKIIYLYYYAVWCPICVYERNNIFKTFNNLEREDIIGFEVHFNDGIDTEEDREITRKYGVFSQHTHIIINKQGNEIYQSLKTHNSEKLTEKLLEL